MDAMSSFIMQMVLPIILVAVAMSIAFVIAAMVFIGAPAIIDE